jgi:arylsulfatase
MIAHMPGSGRPNILMVITDQQRADAVGYENSKVYTPHLDTLAATGTVCNLAFAQSPQCQPSRASLLTGRYPTAHRVWWNELTMPATERTIANYLADAGYSTGYFGKLHFYGDDGHGQTARHFGFQQTFLMEDWMDMVSGKRSGLKGPSLIEQEFYGPMGQHHWTGRFTHREIHHEEVITAKAIDFIRTAPRPFLAVVGFHGPHPPYAAPDEFSRLYNPQEMTVPSRVVYNYHGQPLSDSDWRDLKVQYYGAVSWIDYCLGQLLAEMDSTAIVVYTSDHGDILGDHGYFSKGLFAYEGNVRVPLVLRIPPFAGYYPHLVQHIDLVPTLLRLAGVAVPPGIQGHSLVEVLQSGDVLNRHVLSMIGYSPRLRMLRTERFKYWMYDQIEVVFDLKEDPGETRNIHRNLSLLLHLRGLLLKSLIQCEDPLPVPPVTRR